MMFLLGILLILLALFSIWNHLDFLGINIRYLLDSIKASGLLK